ncbi:MAG: PDZ domain-containing protein [Planctomycetota bacterium]
MVSGFMIRAVALLTGLLVMAGCNGFERRASSFKENRWEIPVRKSVPAPEGKEVTSVSYAITGSNDRVTLLRRTEHPTGYLGAVLLQVDATPQPGAEPYFGVLLGRIADKTPAQIAGLEENDLVISADGEAMSNALRLKYLIESHDLAKPLQLVIERRRERREFSIPLTTRQSQEAESEQFNLHCHEDRDFSGGDLGQLHPEVARYFFENGETGVILMAIQPGSPLFYSKLRRGDVLLTADDERIASVEQLLEVFEHRAKGGASVRITAQRGFKTITAEFKPRVDYESDFRISIPIVGTYSLQTDSTELGIGFASGWIFNYEFDADYSSDDEPYHSRKWGLVLNLITYRNDGERRRMRLLWFIPIRW